MARNNSIIGILINIQKAGNGDKAAIGALKNIQKTVGEATAIFGTLVASGFAINKAFESTGGLFIDYAKDVRGLSQAFGLTSEEASRLIQLTDDLGISQDALTKSLKAMSSNGVQPSLAGLQTLSEKFSTIQDPAAQAKFLVDNFGKSGLEMAAAMRMGADGLQTMNDAVQDSLVLTKAAMNSARAYEIQVDALSDSWTAFMMTIGREVVPGLNDIILREQAVINVKNRMNIATGDGVLIGKEYYAAIEAEYQALKSLQDAQIAAETGAQDLTDADEELIAAERELQSLSAALAAGLSGDYAEAYETYENAVLSAQEKIIKAQEGLDGLKRRTKKNAEEWDAFNDAIREGNSELIKAHENITNATAAMIYHQAAAGLDVRASLKLARALGLISEADYAIAEAIEILKERRDEETKQTGDAEAANEKYVQSVERLNNLIRGLPPETVIRVVTQFIEEGSATTTTGDGGGGTCFLAGTQVDTPNGPRNIESLKVGDEIVSMETVRGERILARVARVLHHPAEEIRGYLVINHFLKVTSNHRVFTSTGWKEAGALVIGEPLRAWNGWIFVNSIERVDLPVPTYNIETDHESHNYFADGILAHNAKAGGDPGMAEGGISTGPMSGHMELLHGTEVVTTQSQFSDIMRAFSNIANGAAGGGGGMNVTINVYGSADGAEIAREFMQVVESSGRRW